MRWSAAKGIGRITMRLPKDFADEVVAAVMEQFSDPDDDSGGSRTTIEFITCLCCTYISIPKVLIHLLLSYIAWHGGCLALAELSRRGLLLPSRLDMAVPLIVKAIHFDVLRGQHSVGAHVRDAACYVCWAFSRAYSPAVMAPYIKDLSAAMLLTSLYDREINCRRAASAAFQENVGRQGNESFTNGIEIITIADYFSVGNRTAAYLKLAPTIAGLDSDTCNSFLGHLKRTQLTHWDEEIRLLSSKAIAKLASIRPDLALSVLPGMIAECLSIKLNVRHGCILGTAEVLFALASAGEQVGKDLISQIVEIPASLEKNRLYRGRGGELVRYASCFLIERIATSNIALSAKNKVQNRKTL